MASGVSFCHHHIISSSFSILHVCVCAIIFMVCLNNYVSVANIHIYIYRYVGADPLGVPADSIFIICVPTLSS